jgi:eukaryotic-like serine/threonine-protein kinase
VSARGAHLEIDVLDRFASGVLDEPHRSSTEKHLSSCDSCRARLSELQQDLELAAALRALSPAVLPAVEETPPSFGDYRVLREIGRGGMGIVFEAEQASPRRRVALKVLGTLGFAGSDIERMLRREAQALARLEHPSVARIYDVGRLPDGRPYLAMELVDGQTLTRYASDHALSRRDRLLLFTQLCDAVAFAHQRGVIHRDLKPSNVLVDKSGRPRVLDFGLARVLDVEGEAGVSVSVDTGRIRGTLAFMSPEQARGDEHLVDARSDVYSLGVILYTLLLDRLPYEIPSANLPEAVRVICDKAPARPSEFDRSLRGDLETILRHALEKEPDQRYATVAALRDDVMCFLERQPIQARAPSFFYQLGKLVQRHPLTFATAAAIFLAAIGVGIWTSALYRDADTQRHLATEALADKAAEATRAQEMVELLEQMLGSANMHESRGADFTVRALLDEFSNNFGEQLRDQPDIEASLRATIARAYVTLGLPAEARKHIEIALELQRKAAKPDEALIASLLENRAWCTHDEGNFEQAEKEFRDVLEARKRLTGPNDADVSRLQYCVGDVLRHRGDDQGAEAMAREALGTLRAIGGEETEDQLTPLSLLGQTLQDRGQLAEAKEVYDQAVELSVRVSGEHHRNTASLVANRGVVSAMKGEQAAAEADYSRALAIRRELVHGDHPEIARVLNNFGELRRNQGRSAEAVELLRESLEMRERILPPMHPDMAQTYGNLALALYATGDIDQSIECAKKCVEIRRAGDHDPLLPLALTNYASILRARSEFDTAIELCREALAIQEERPAPDREIATTLLALGRTHREHGDFAEAEPELRRAMEIRIKAFGEQSTQVAECKLHLGVALRSMGQGADAEPLLRSSADTYVAVLGDKHHNGALARTELGVCLRDLGRLDEAEAALLAAHGVLDAKFGANDARTKRAARELAAVYEKLERADEAERWRTAGTP